MNKVKINELIEDVWKKGISNEDKNKYKSMTKKTKDEICRKLCSYIEICDLDNSNTRAETLHTTKAMFSTLINYNHKIKCINDSIKNVKTEIDNAIVGEDYRFNLCNIFNNDKLIKITSADMECVLGLNFDMDNQCIYGTPSMSGTYNIKIMFKIAASNVKDEFIHHLKITITDKPDSLWKVKEPDNNLPYKKEHQEACIIDSLTSHKIIAASIRGRTHAHAGTFRDDDFYIKNIPDTEWSVLVVADGAGSAKLSREGSRLAVNAIGDHLSTKLSNGYGDELKNCLTSASGNYQETLSNACFSELNSLFFSACKDAVAAIEVIARENNATPREFSTTMLAAIALPFHDKLFVSAFGIGDGVIATWTPPEEVKILNKPDGGEFAGQTLFLDRNALQHHFKGRTIISIAPQSANLILMTDGISDPYFETDNGLTETARWNKLWTEVNRCLHDEKSVEKLTEWLNFPSPGHHDDRTIAILTKNNTHEAEYLCASTDNIEEHQGTASTGDSGLTEQLVQDDVTNETNDEVNTSVVVNKTQNESSDGITNQETTNEQAND